MLHIAIVDDEQAHRDILSEYIRQWAAKARAETDIKTYTSGEAFYFAWSDDQSCDVVFLDIMMGGTNGVSLAKTLREKGTPITIIFTTGIPDYMQEGYEVEALHYLLKPLQKEKVWQCLEKCRERLEKQQSFVLLPAQEGLIRIAADDVLCAEAMGHCCILTCAAGTYEIKTGIQQLHRKLSEHGNFPFCHRSYLVNIQKISKITKTDLLLEGGCSVPVSRRMYDAINRQFIATLELPGHI